MFSDLAVFVLAEYVGKSDISSDFWQRNVMLTKYSSHFKCIHYIMDLRITSNFSKNCLPFLPSLF